MSTRIKICGLTSVDEVNYLQDDNVEFAGLVMFYEKSKRNNTPESAKPIISALKELSNSSQIKIVAVTVSPTLEQLKIVEALGFDIIQIHGELSEEVLHSAKIPIFRAYNLSSDLLNEHLIKEDNIKGILFDGKVSGGGEVFDWSLLKKFNRNGKLLILAGGLDETNVAQAIQEVNPDIVDVSSGVEYLDVNIKGKDPQRIKSFIEAVQN